MKDPKDAALKYLTNRSRSAMEVRQHLKSKEFDSSEIAATLEFLLDFHYVDDEEYARQYFEYGFMKGKGFGRIKQELYQKGIDGQLAEQVFRQNFSAEAGYDERERALKQVEKIARDQEIDDKLVAKAARRLASLGYSSEVVYSVIEALRRRKGSVEEE